LKTYIAISINNINNHVTTFFLLKGDYNVLTCCGLKKSSHLNNLVTINKGTHLVRATLSLLNT